MKNTVFTFCCTALCFTLLSSELEDNSKLKAEADRLHDQISGLRQELADMSVTEETLATTRDLISGKLKTPPKPKTAEKRVQICSFEEKAPAVFVRTGQDKKSITSIHWLNLTEGKRYRFEAEVKLENVVKTDGVQFMLWIQLNGKSDWPGANVGAGTFDWKKTSFECTIPFGRKSCALIYGLQLGEGKMYIRNVKGWCLE